MLTVPRYPSHSSPKGGILHNHSAIIIAKELTLCCVAQSLSCVQLFVTPWTAACQASLSFTTSQSLLKFISIESVIHPTILSSVTCFSSCLQSFAPSGSFLMSQLFTSGDQSIGASTSASVFSMNNSGLISLQFKGLSVFSNTTIQNNQFLVFNLLYGPILTTVYN